MKDSITDKKDSNISDNNVDPLALAAWRAQAFWGFLVWVDEKIISSDLKMRHYYTIAALVDSEARHAAGATLEKMTSTRLTTSMRKDFHGEYDQCDPELSQKQAENDLAFMRSKDNESRALIYKDEGCLGWRPTDRGIRIIQDIADDLGRLALTQAKLLGTLAPERTEQVTETDGFYNRAKKLLTGIKSAKALLAQISFVVAAVTAISLFGGPRLVASEIARALCDDPAPTLQLLAVGPRDFGDGTLTTPSMV